MSKNILVLPGDGIGQEVTASATKVLEFLIEKYSLDFSVTSMDVGGTAYDQYGSPLPEEVLNSAKEADAILFGAVGGPKWDNLDWDLRPENALLTLRKELNLFANLLKKNFLLIGKINKNPKISVANPGIINNKAAKAMAAPDITS